jgi:hypothetical protein
MSAAPHTSTNPATETPSTSETGGNSLYPKGSVSAANVPDQESKVGQTDVSQGSAEKAAEKLYEGECRGYGVAKVITDNMCTHRKDRGRVREARGWCLSNA